ncbi:hypothetical protein ACP70R_024313 [Stipagrostis hirtigluma subsp. patula]
MLRLDMGEGSGMKSEQTDGVGWSDPNRFHSLEIADKGSCLSSQSSVTNVTNVGASMEAPSLLATVCSQTALPIATFDPPAVIIDWDNLEIDDPCDEEGRIDIIDHDKMCDLLGLKANEERDNKNAEAAANEEAAQAASREAAKATEYLSQEGAIPIDDILPDERQIRYDKENPKIELGAMFPNMKEFRLAVRQYAINGEFELGTEKSDKKRFRGFCTGEGCPWRINGNKLSEHETITVTLLVDEHKCTSTARIKTTTPSQAWVADKAVSILTKNPNMSTKEMLKQLQDDYSVTIHYDTVWKGRERALQELYGSWEESFHMLYRWKAEIEKRSPGRPTRKKCMRST